MKTLRGQASHITVSCSQRLFPHLEWSASPYTALVPGRVEVRRLLCQQHSATISYRPGVTARRHYFDAAFIPASASAQPLRIGTTATSSDSATSRASASCLRPDAVDLILPGGKAGLRSETEGEGSDTDAAVTLSHTQRHHAVPEKPHLSGAQAPTALQEATPAFTPPRSLAVPPRLLARCRTQCPASETLGCT